MSWFCCGSSSVYRHVPAVFSIPVPIGNGREKGYHGDGTVRDMKYSHARPSVATTYPMGESNFGGVCTGV